MSHKYIIGVDGGGTKTKGARFDLNGHIEKEVIFGPSNISVDQDQALKLIDQVIEALTQSIDIKHIAQIILGIAGAGKITDHNDYLKPLTAKYNVPILLTTDAHIALYAIDKLPQEAAMLILSGTGSTIMVRGAETTHMIGGYGHILGDQGSAYHLVIQAVKTMIKHHEEDSEPTPFEHNFREHLKLKDIQDIKAFIYSKTKTEIAHIAKFISTCALAGDTDAQALLIEEGHVLAKQAINAYRKLKQPLPLHIAYKGGFIEEAPLVKDACSQKITESISNYRITTEVKDPIIGAFQMAKSQLRGLDK